MFPLHKLQVYAQARLLATAAYKLGCSIPDRDLRSQLTRAARAIPANLAEGAGSESQANFARYVAIALASAKETEGHLHLAADAGIVPPEACAAMHAELDNLTPRLVRLLHVIRQNARRRTRSAS